MNPYLLFVTGIVFGLAIMTAVILLVYYQGR